LFQLSLLNYRPVYDMQNLPSTADKSYFGTFFDKNQQICADMRFRFANVANFGTEKVWQT
jgi:hypothetical protein